MIRQVFNPFTSNFDTISIVTMGAVGSTPNASGASIDPISQVLILQPANGTNPGVVSTSAQIFGGQKTFNAPVLAPGFDVPDSGSPSDTLNIGVDNADILNIGNSNTIINLYGTTFYQNVTNLQVTDKLITVNKNGAVASGFGAGMEIEEDGVITGYASTSADRNSWELKAPNTAGIAVITPGASGIVLDQSSHDPFTLGPVGLSPNANGAILVGQELSLQGATANFPGVLMPTDFVTFSNKLGSLSGDVVATGPASASTIQNDVVTNAKLANMAANTIKGNNTEGTADPIDLSTTQVTAMLNNFVGDAGSGGTKGLVPAPASGDAAANKYLRADGTWSSVSVAASELRNYLLNSNFDIWQRGTSIEASNVIGFTRYTADRWYTTNSMGIGSQTVTDRIGSLSLPNSRYAARVRVDVDPTAPVSTFYSMTQIIDAQTSEELYNKVVSLSGKFLAIGNINQLTLEILYNTSESKTGLTSIATATVAVSTGAWVTGSLPNITIPTAMGDVGVVAVRVSASGVSTGNVYDLGNGFNMTQMSLVRSPSIAATYSMASPNSAAELLACQRFYEKSYEIDTAPATISAVGMIAAAVKPGNDLQSQTTFKYAATKRVLPTLSLYNSAATPNVWMRSTNGAAATNVTVAAGSFSGRSSGSVLMTFAANTDIGFTFGHWVADAEI